MPQIIDKSIFDYLKKLAQNNDRDWFAENKVEFREVEMKAKLFFEALKEKMQAFDEIEKLKVYRIYRDVRFSADKTPYKTHFAAAYQRAGQQRRGGYYLQINPGSTFLAGGFFGPENDDLLRIRQEFEMDDAEMRKIMGNPKFKKTFGDLEGEELKTAPKGFSKEDGAIDLIRKKQFIFRRYYTDEEVLSEDFLNMAAADFQLLLPFFNYMSEVLTTDLNGERIF